MSVIYHREIEQSPTPDAVTPKPGSAEVRYPCDYVSTSELNAIAEGDWSAYRGKTGAFEVCQFDDPGALLIPPSVAIVSIADPDPSWGDGANGADSERVAGLGDEAYLTGLDRVLGKLPGSGPP